MEQLTLSQLLSSSKYFIEWNNASLSPFFNTTYHGELIDNKWFITSDKPDNIEFYNVREVKNGMIKTHGEYGELTTLNQAKELLNTLRGNNQ